MSKCFVEKLTDNDRTLLIGLFCLMRSMVPSLPGAKGFVVPCGKLITQLWFKLPGLFFRVSIWSSPFSYFSTSFIPGSANSDGSGQFKQTVFSVLFHGFGSRNEEYTGERIEQVIGMLSLFFPFNSAENMQPNYQNRSGDCWQEVHSFCNFPVFCSFNAEFIDDGQPGVWEQTNDHAKWSHEQFSCAFISQLPVVANLKLNSINGTLNNFHRFSAFQLVNKNLPHRKRFLK